MEKQLKPIQPHTLEGIFEILEAIEDSKKLADPIKGQEYLVRVIARCLDKDPDLVEVYQDAIGFSKEFLSKFEFSPKSQFRDNIEKVVDRPDLSARQKTIFVLNSNNIQKP